jgi:alpha-ketoglutaric semialdehyde dehydrogenase
MVYLTDAKITRIETALSLACGELVTELVALNRDLGMPVVLKTLGVTEELFGLVVKTSLGSPRPRNESCTAHSEPIPATVPCGDVLIMETKMHKNLINGEWVAGEGTENINPSDTNDVVGVYTRATLNDTKQAIAAAKAAFPTWARSGLLERHAILRKASDEILMRKDELGRLLSREEGKTLAEGIGESVRAAQIFDFFAGEVLRLAGETLASVRPGITIDITREPIGVVGVITPWNFPIAIPAWKIAPALCYGNTVVFKPADLVPGSAWMIVDILHRAGLPKGVLNLVMGRGSVVGQVMLDSPDISAITFTGSVGTGKRVAAASIEHNRKFQLEMGGKNPMVVLDDADLGVAVDCAVNSAFFSTGQRCTASSRLIVTEGIHDHFVAAMTERMEKLVVDNALKPGTHIGPVVDPTQLKQDIDYIEIGKTEGARLVTGGERIERETPGYFLKPALFVEATNQMRISREEIFGPVASVIRVKGYDEALAVANDTQFGLSSGICTASLKHASHFKRNAEAGMVMVNLPTAGVDFHVPFGGRKASSYGAREQGKYAAEFFTTVKTAYTQP